jgi:Peptidase inhibitor I78 family
MMQFNQSTWRLAAILALVACGGCNPWFDYAPKGTMPNTDLSATCPAKDLQYLVGQPRTVLYTMRFGSEVRFEEPGQMYTQDFKATRTRIIIGGDGKIARILCG